MDRKGHDPKPSYSSVAGALPAAENGSEEPIAARTARTKVLLKQKKKSSKEPKDSTSSQTTASPPPPPPPPPAPSYTTAGGHQILARLPPGSQTYQISPGNNKLPTRPSQTQTAGRKDTNQFILQPAQGLTPAILNPTSFATKLIPEPATSSLSLSSTYLDLTMHAPTSSITHGMKPIIPAFRTNRGSSNETMTKSSDQDSYKVTPASFPNEATSTKEELSDDAASQSYVPPEPNHDWRGPIQSNIDPDFIKEADSIYAQEKKALQANPRTDGKTGNGLLDTLYADNKKRNEEAAKKKAVAAAAAGSKAPTPARLSRMQKIVQDAARSSSASSSKLSNRNMADFEAGRRILIDSELIDEISNRPASPNPHAIPSKPMIPFDHDHYKKCPNWLADYDPQANAIEDERRKQRFAAAKAVEAAMAKASSEKKAEAGPKNSGASGASHTNLRGGGLGYDLTDSEPEYYGNDEQGEEQDDDSDNESERSSSGGPSGQGETHSQLYNPNDEVSYTQTKTWISKEEEMRIQYTKTLANFHHARMDHSPALPESMVEYLDLKANILEAKVRHDEAVLRQQEQESQRQRLAMTLAKDPKDACKGTKVELAPRLQKIAMADTMTPVLGRDSIWHPSKTNNPDCDWPSYKEFKLEGDRRATGHYGRCFPLPRLRKLDSKYQHLADGPEALPTEGPLVPWEYRKISMQSVIPRNDLLTCREGAMLDKGPKAHEIKVDECDAWTADLLKDISDC